MQWHEPAAYRRAIYYENERSNPLDSLKLAAGTFVLLLLLRFIAGSGPESHPPPWWPHSIALAVGVALVVAYGMPALMSLMPGSIVILSDKGVNNNKLAGRGWVIRFWPWEQIAYVSTSTDTAGGKTYRVISLHGEDDGVLVTLALTDKTSLEGLQRYIEAHGKTVSAAY